MKAFAYWKNRFANDELLDFSCTEEGRLWLKLRSIDRRDLIEKFCDKLGIARENRASENLWARINNVSEAKSQLLAFMQDCQKQENQAIDKNFEAIRSNLYKMRHFHWGGGYRNSLDKAIVSRYVKTGEIIPYEQLEQICEGEILEMTRGYLFNSWYNYWSSVLLENVFRRNCAVMPAFGKIKNVDFFVKDFPFDLKVTYLPKEYAVIMRQKLQISEPLTKLRQYAKTMKIPFSKEADEDTMQYELAERIKDASQIEGIALLDEIKREWRETVKYILSHKRDLIKWLYENQGGMRFGSENRIFLIMVDLDNPSDAWKLKRNVDLISPQVTEWIDNFDCSRTDDLMLSFSYNSKQYKTYADAIFICK